MSFVELNEARDKFEADEKLLNDSVDYGEWAKARESRLKGLGNTPEKYSIINNAFMGWMVGLIKRGRSKKALERADLPGLRSSYLSSTLYPEFCKVYNGSQDPSAFQRALFRVPQVRRTIFVGSIFSSIQGILGTVGRPIVLAMVVDAVEQNSSMAVSIGYVLVFAAVVFFEGWFGVIGRQLLSEEFGTQFQNCASSAVYSKMLRINTQRAQDDRSSESSLIGNDIVRAYENIRTASNLPMAITGVIGGIVVLLVMIGTPALVGIAIMLAIMGLNVVIGKVTHRIEQKNLVAADERLSVMNAVVEGIRAVKLFGWETSFKTRLEKVRDVECTHIRNYRLAHVFSIVSGRASPVLSSMATLVYYALSGQELSIATAYATVTVFQALRLGLIFVPLCFTAVMTFTVTLKRLNKYFRRQERPPGSYLPSPSDETLRDSPEEETLLAEMINCDVGWIGDMDASGTNFNRVLQDVSLKVTCGQLVGVVGKVGCGKSTLLSTLIQVLSPLPKDGDTSDSTVRTVRDVGYAPQKPFVVCGTVKQNILLGRPYDEEKMKTVLKRSGLHGDIKLFSNGIQTEIGERGTTLSGGQQSRLGVARALYGDPDLLVLDDPLSAVDSKVCNHMFEHSILAQITEGKKRRRKGCVIALNQLGLLSRMDWIVFLDEGKVLCQGKYQTLMDENTSFHSFVTMFSKAEENESLVPSPIGLPVLSPAVREVDTPLLKASIRLNEEISYDRHLSAVSSVGDLESGISDTKENNPSSILQAEVRTHGEISRSIYARYFRSMGFVFFTVCFLFSLLGYVVMAINDYWLTLWSNSIAANENRDTYYAGVYAALSVVFGILILSSSWMLCFGGVKASKTLHNSMLERLLRAPMYWFESTATGRIISRFSGDLSKVDMILSLSVDNLIQILCTLLVLLAVLCVAVPVMTAVIVVTAILFCLLMIALDKTSREVRRMSNDSMSPLLSNATEATRGRDLILVMNCTQFFEARHRLANDEYARCNFLAGTVINWGMLASQMLSFVVSVCTASLLVLLHNTFSTDLIGISLAYAFVIPYFASTTTQVYIRMNSFFTSFERLLEYDRLPQEISFFQSDENPTPSREEWPTKGSVAFQDVSLRYRPGLPMILQDLNFVIPSQSSVGICGKTGAGKSSLIAALFRLVELEGGKISIDGRDISTISLDVLRSTLTIIPQDPILMEGTVRSNLDPFEDYSLDELENALKLVGLLGQVNLDDPVEEGGRNWSCGERQLLSFARAALRPSPILILDEPTSSIDTRTDELIQAMIKREFIQRRRSTVLTIAHRLNTICDFDLILVMQKGRVREFDSPKALLADPTSEFFSMVDALGPTSRAKLYEKVGMQAPISSPATTVVEPDSP